MKSLAMQAVQRYLESIHHFRSFEHKERELAALERLFNDLDEGQQIEDILNFGHRVCSEKNHRNPYSLDDSDEI